jgi:hypothetical protein
MSQPVISALVAFAAGILGAVVTLLAQRQRNVHERLLHEQTHKTEFMAEITARYFLNHPKYTDRSFDHLKKRLGGFTDDELRKILVRSGATRHIRSDNSEWWRLLSRDPEARAKRNKTADAIAEEDEDF